MSKFIVLKTRFFQFFFDFFLNFWAFSGTFEATKPLFASIGFEVFAKKAMAANFSTNMTCPKCRNVTFTPDSTHATTRNVHFCTLIPRARLGIARGTIVDFVVTALYAVTDTFDEYFA